MTNPITDLPSELTISTRTEERDRCLRDYSYWMPSDNTSPGTVPYAWASATADGLAPLYHDVRTIADAQDPEKIGGAQLDRAVKADGIPPRLPASGSSGSVTIAASSGGTTIISGDVGQIADVRYQCSATALYHNGDEVPVQAIDVGPQTNANAGLAFVWASPRPGCASTAVVTAQTDGTGLTGGRLAETDDELRLRWQTAVANRASAGNDAHIQELAEDSRATGVAVQKCFTFPCCLGSGTTGLVFTMSPASIGASRVPNNTQRAAVIANVIGGLPGDESIFDVTLIPQAIDVVLQVAWDTAAAGWTDQTPWPRYAAATAKALIIGTVTDSTHFTIATAVGGYSGVTAPSIGNTIAVYDEPNATFRRKKILTVGGSGPWTIVCDTSNSASDTSYTPIAGQRVMPWSDSLQAVLDPVRGYFDTLGPGEQQAVFFDEGVRQRRSPRAPKDWPSSVTTKGLEGALVGVSSLLDVTIAEPTLPSAPSVGTPGVTAYILTLNRLAILPL
jgi:uncharacterized phage protein gp47/JayE